MSNILEKLEERMTTLVYESIGEASMCWTETPKGVFDSDRAKNIGDRLMNEILPLIELAKVVKWFDAKHKTGCSKHKFCICGVDKLDKAIIKIERRDV